MENNMALTKVLEVDFGYIIRTPQGFYRYATTNDTGKKDFWLSKDRRNAEIFRTAGEALMIAKELSSRDI